MSYSFKKMKKGSYFGHVDEHPSNVYRKTGTYTFEDAKTGEEFDIKNTYWHGLYDSEIGMFCLAEVEVTLKIKWRPEW